MTDSSITVVVVVIIVLVVVEGDYATAAAVGLSNLIFQYF